VRVRFGDMPGCGREPGGDGAVAWVRAGSVDWAPHPLWVVADGGRLARSFDSDVGCPSLENDRWIFVNRFSVKDFVLSYARGPGRSPGFGWLDESAAQS
jgi:hypothetical protein